jgi:hypothetical protein
LASDRFFSSKDQAMRLIPFGELLSTSWPCPRAECHYESESGQPPEVGPASAHRRRPGAAPLRRRGHDRRGSERRRGTERRGNLDLAPATWIARLGSRLRGLRSEPAFWLLWLLLMTAAICWLLSALKVVEWAIPLISVTVILAGSIAIMNHQLYLGATAEQRATDLETKHADLERLLNAMETKLRGVQAELDLAIADREDLRKLIEEKTRDSTAPAQEA